MLDPFRGEMTARYVESERLAWAARERLARQARTSDAGRSAARRSDVGAQLGRLLRLRRESPARESRQEAA